MQAVKKNSFIEPSLFALTWPIFIESFLHMLMGSTDTFMLSYVSDDAVAAVGVANQLIFFTILIFGFVATGTTVLVSQNLGAGLLNDARRISGISISLNLIFGIAISALVVLFKGQFLNLFDLTPEIHRLAGQYLTIVGATLFSQALLVTASSILRANGFSKEAMMISIFMNIIHLAGNSILIYGLFGMPQMGIQGVALSTAASRAIAVAMIFWLLYKRLPVRIKKEDYTSFNPVFIKKILKIGIPSAGENLVYNTSQMAMTAIIAMIGAMALTTRVYTWNVMAFMMLFAIALGQGTQILVGYKVGAGDYDGAYHRLLKSVKLSLIMTIIVVIPLVLFRENLLDIFTDNQEIISVGAKLLLLGIILEPGRTLNIVIIAALRAAGDANFPVKMAFVSMWGIGVPLGYFLGITMGYGLVGIWIAFIADEWFRGIVMYFRWKSRVWEKKSLVEAEVQPV
ncbi:MATE family efflux transporter [Bacillus sp. B-jedd]|uniref:MATE family efflux transporter n=1 Tax=Bacillus sp. B-jedd TaxID=1476857 RepID=UPI0005156110|nr:MATE family efflux transporter [Bacillus sp. B-jedd]CEG25788.1 Na+driven efflux transporter [Bacillus sp. B-jedd]